MRKAAIVALLALVSCFNDAEAPSPDMPEHTAHAGCLEVGVERVSDRRAHADQVPLAITFQNQCGVAVEVDLRKLDVEGEGPEGRRALHAYDPRLSMHPGRLDPRQRAEERLAFGPIDASYTRVCIDPSHADVAHVQQPAGVVCLDVPPPRDAP